MSGLLEIKHNDNIFIAKGNVKHTTGGPTMALVGFIHPRALSIFKDLNETLSHRQQRFVSEKIYIDKEKGIGFFDSIYAEKFYGNVYPDAFENVSVWMNENTFSGKFLCVVRFYNEEIKKFIYKIFNPLELQLA